MADEELRRVERAIDIAEAYLSDDADSPGDPYDCRRARAVLASSLDSLPTEDVGRQPEQVKRAAILLVTSWVKDRDINGERATDQALQVLNDRFDLQTTNDAELLVAAATIHRTRWELSAQWRELRRALYLYERASRGSWGSGSDALLGRAEAKLHAAFLLDTLARQEERALRQEATTWTQRVPVVDDDGVAVADTTPTKYGSTAPTHRRDAEGLRRSVVEQLEQARRHVVDPTTGDDADHPDDPRRIWKVYLLIAEAHVGLRNYDQASAAIAEGARWQPPNQRRLQEAAKRFIELARLRGIRPEVEDDAASAGLTAQDLERALALHKEGRSYGDIAAALRFGDDAAARDAVIAGAQAGSRRVVETLLGLVDEDDVVDLVNSAFAGKLGLALSGGGFRASLFHIGVLAQLAEQGLLPEIQTISCVSGGSILGAQYYLLVQDLLERFPDDELKQDSDAHFIGIVQELVDLYDEIIRKNMRARIFANPLATAGIWPSPSRRVGRLMHRHLLPQVRDPGNGRPRTDLRDIKITPKGWSEGEEFKPKHHNWQRKHKVPVLILNATSLNTGHNWQFSAVHVGEPPTLIDSQIDSGAHLARVRLEEPQGRRFRAAHRARRAATVPISLGEAVAASAAVPGLFQPLQVAGLYPDWLLKLADGGVVDNQGIGGLLEQGSDTMLISDASRQLASSPAPAGGLTPALRSNSIAYNRIRAAQYDELRTRRRSGLVRDVVFVHLNRDLEGPRIKPRASTVAKASDDAAPALPSQARRLRTKRAARGLRPPDWTQQMVLSVMLKRDSAMPLDAVAAAIPGVPWGAVSRAVGSLVARNLVEHLPGSQAYQITRTGRRAAEAPTTSYGIARSIQNTLARTRTDLNTFTQAEAYALMTSGYLMTRHALATRQGIGPYRAKNDDDHLDTERWRFLRIARVMGEPDAALAKHSFRLERHLAGGRRSLRLPSNLLIGSVAAATAAAAAVLAFLGLLSPVAWAGEVVSLGTYTIPVPRLLIAVLPALTLLGVVVMLWTRVSGRPPTRPFAVLAKASFLPVGLVLAVGSWFALMLGRLTSTRGSVDSFLPPEDRQRWSLAAHLPDLPRRAAPPS